MMTRKITLYDEELKPGWSAEAITTRTVNRLREAVASEKIRLTVGSAVFEQFLQGLIEAAVSHHAKVGSTVTIKATEDTSPKVTVKVDGETQAEMGQ